MSLQSVIILLLLIGLAIFAAWWHVRENRQLESILLQKKIDAETSTWLLHFAQTRTYQLLLCATFSIIIIASYDWKLSQTNDAVANLQQIHIADVKLKSQASAEIAAPAQEDTAATPTATTPVASPSQPVVSANQSNPITPPTGNPQLPDYAPPPAEVVLKLNTGESPIESNAIAAIENQIESPSAQADNTGATESPVITNANTLEQVYNPERSQGEGSDAQTSMDDMKKRYEDILVIYMFLKQCGRIQTTDYNVITSALSQEMASVNAPGRLQADIVTAAKGSYQEIYSQSPCEGDSVNKLAEQYHQYIDTLKTNFPPE